MKHFPPLLFTETHPWTQWHALHICSHATVNELFWDTFICLWPPELHKMKPFAPRCKNRCFKFKMQQSSQTAFLALKDEINFLCSSSLCRWNGEKVPCGTPRCCAIIVYHYKYKRLCFLFSFSWETVLFCWPVITWMSLHKSARPRRESQTFFLSTAWGSTNSAFSWIHPPQVPFSCRML